MKNIFRKIYFNILKVFLRFFALLKFKKSSFDFDNGHKQTELDKKLVYSLSKARIPNLKQLKYINRFLSTSERWIIRACFLILFLSLVFISAKFYITHLQVVPLRSGHYTEGLVGGPNNINPLYAGLNDVDGDIASLIYSSLFKRDKNNRLVNDLVNNYNISDDSKVYTFFLKQGIKWHDESFFTVDDVIFTFNAIKDGAYKSPLKASFSGVEIERVDDANFKLVLSDPYAAFLELLTFGILPADLWAEFPPDSASLAGLNLKPIGTGPYKFLSLAKDEKTGTVKEYNLAVNEYYYDHPPLIDISFRFYNSFEEAIAALNNNTIDGLSYLPQDFRKDIITPKTLLFHKLYLPQLTLIYLNKDKNPALGDKSLRQALIYAIDRNEIINTVLAGGAYKVNGPILPNSFAYNEKINKFDYSPELADELLNTIDWKTVEISEEEIAKAQEDLNSEDEKTKESAEELISIGAGKWRKKDGAFLTIKLTTVERKENESIVKAIGAYWEKLGIKTELEILPAKRIQSEIIRPRNFEALFYGQVVGADPDPYAFWHSSQAVEGGFNIANYANKDIDELLENARVISDKEARKEKYNKFQEIISEEAPVIFMYSPIYTYVQSKNVNGFDVTNILFPFDRLSNINEWYVETGKKLVW